MFTSRVRRRTTADGKNAFHPAICLLLLLFTIGCAQNIYTVDLKYATASPPSPGAVSQQKYVMTVALFNDARSGGRDLLIGRVTTAMGGLTNVIPKAMSPTTAVSTIVKDVLVKSGHQVSVAAPAWDLQENAIRKDWGDILIGGDINELEIVCRNDIPIKTYDTRVRLTILLADVKTGKIFHRISTTSKNSLEHIYFSEEMLSQQISNALTEAVEKAFEGPLLKEKISTVLK
jgi:hypothetical protein